ncbi:MAG TPA: helicase-related protein, partial [Erysipelothrix sp.]|nr:helicase-related protein [Erysipelothrix sp.]
QVKGMFNGDRSRKQVLVEYGFRLPSALDNRPLNFDEFLAMPKQTIYVSATPGDFELNRTNHHVVEQIIRPTGLLDPIITVKPTRGQIDDLMDQIIRKREKNQRVLVTTLTVKMAEELTNYLLNNDIKAIYLHHETKTLERIETIRQFRKGKYDVLVGINLLREGIDIPEVALVAILDADKEGFLRSTRSLIQTSGRAARNSDGEVIMYADRMTDSMKNAIEETNRRREIQHTHNIEHSITPTTIVKEIRDVIAGKETQEMAMNMLKKKTSKDKKQHDQIIMDLEKEMHEAARVLDFERAATLRDIILELKSQ